MAKVRTSARTAARARTRPERPGAGALACRATGAPPPRGRRTAERGPRPWPPPGRRRGPRRGRPPSPRPGPPPPRRRPAASAGPGGPRGSASRPFPRRRVCRTPSPHQQNLANQEGVPAMRAASNSPPPCWQRKCQLPAKRCRWPPYRVPPAEEAGARRRTRGAQPARTRSWRSGSTCHRGAPSLTPGGRPPCRARPVLPRQLCRASG
mmetsp:Transcript_75466/g.234942  ORF Transcript_75466/g.234942 Transcript_75466/m.234942 type:complete len:208 (+) Transcript_75466:787-1410(+)